MDAGLTIHLYLMFICCHFKGKLFATIFTIVAGTVLLHNMTLISMIPLELRKRRIGSEGSMMATKANTDIFEALAASGAEVLIDAATLDYYAHDVYERINKKTYLSLKRSGRIGNRL